MFKELWNVSGFPLLLHEPAQSFGKKIATLLKVYGLIFLSLIFTSWIVYFTDQFVTQVLHFKSISNQYGTTFQHLFKKNGAAKILLYVCLIGPVLEETVFRLPLSFKRIPVALGIAFAFFLFSGAVPFVKKFELSIGWGYALLIHLAFTAVLFFTCIKFIPDNLSFTTKIKKTIIIISMCLFGLMHILNFIPLQWPLIWIYPVYVLPQLLMGWGITYVRFKRGFIWGIALHCLINSLAMWVYVGHSQPVKTKQPIIAVHKLK